MEIQKITVKLVIQPLTESLKHKQVTVSANKHIMIMVI